MKLTMLSLCLALAAIAQEGPPPPPGGGPGGHRMPEPKNLKILKPDQVMPAMRAFTASLGVRCDFCHVQGDFASDEKHHKEIARRMLVMTHKINEENFPGAEMRVTCFTCHRGASEPPAHPDQSEHGDHDHADHDHAEHKTP